jgi:hypothetical protein
MQSEGVHGRDPEEQFVGSALKVQPDSFAARNYLSIYNNGVACTEHGHV